MEGDENNPTSPPEQFKDIQSVCPPLFYEPTSGGGRSPPHINRHLTQQHQHKNGQLCRHAAGGERQSLLLPPPSTHQKCNSCRRNLSASSPKICTYVDGSPLPSNVEIVTRPRRQVSLESINAYRSGTRSAAEMNNGVIGGTRTLPPHSNVVEVTTHHKGNNALQGLFNITGSMLHTYGIMKIAILE